MNFLCLEFWHNKRKTNKFRKKYLKNLFEFVDEEKNQK